MQDKTEHKMEVDTKPIHFKVKFTNLYSDVFDNNVQLPVTNYKVIVRLEQNVTPIFRKSYKYQLVWRKKCNKR